MKKLLLLIGSILLLSGISFAQQSSGDRVALGSGARIDAELQSAIDVKKSKVGDQVVLKTTKAIKRGGQTLIPKGTQLLGRITEVQEKTKSNATSRIGMVIDRIQGKDLTGPINASIVSIISAQANASAADTLDTGISGSASSPGRTTTSGTGSGGGGLLGGVTNTVGGVTGAATQTVGATTSAVGQTVGTVTDTAGQAVGTTTGSVGRTIGGIQISQSASGSVRSSNTLSAAGKNIKLDKGVTFQLRFNED